MHGKIRLILPAFPYLIGVGMQVSGITSVVFSVGAFELAAIIAAAVAWSYWTEWHQKAVDTAYGSDLFHRVYQWQGFKIPRVGTLSSPIIVGLLTLIICNAAMGALYRWGDRGTPAHVESAYAPQLRKFYTETGELFFQTLPKDMSPEDFDAWAKNTEDKEQYILNWVLKNMGREAEQRLGDTHFPTMPPHKFALAINDRHNQLLFGLWVIQGNLKSMIETTMWDPHDDSQKGN